VLPTLVHRHGAVLPTLVHRHGAVSQPQTDDAVIRSVLSRWDIFSLAAQG